MSCRPGLAGRGETSSMRGLFVGRIARRAAAQLPADSEVRDRSQHTPPRGAAEEENGNSDDPIYGAEPAGQLIRYLRHHSQRHEKAKSHPCESRREIEPRPVESIIHRLEPRKG